MAHKKAGGSTALGRDSVSKRLGVKLSGGQPARAGMIIIRQRGSRFRAGVNVRKGNDDTLYAVSDGKVRYQKRRVRTFTGKSVIRNIVHIEPNTI